MRSRVITGLITLISSFGIAVMAVPSAEAIGPINAGYAADGEAADFCTPHTAGVCMARNGYISSGRGGGAWNGVAQSWGCYWFEPCSNNGFNSTAARQQSRWYDQECFVISASGSVTSRRRC